tara:strand:+ start:3087 stop:3740 length:654 start_codon:yes stop_codon:yes gene_type:complete
MRRTFKSKSFITIPNFLDKEQINLVKKELKEEKYFSISDIRENRNNNRLIDLINNKVYWYEYPNSIFKQYNYLKDKKSISNSGILKKVEDYASQLNKLSMRVETIECYLTKPVEEKIFNSQWHKDGDHKSSIRCLIYLSNVNDTTKGQLQVRRKDFFEEFFGDEGDCILFQNSILEHRGINTCKERLCLNIKLCPGSKPLRNYIYDYEINYQGSLFW